MLSWMCRRFTYANVAMTLALVFAMSGGAYAASKYLVTSTKQISPKVLKSLQGKTGKTGKTGPAGAQGPQGSQGTAGTNGTSGTPGGPGANGKSVVSGVEAKGANCKEGGSNFEVEGSATKHYVCNGEKGAAGLAGAPGAVGPEGVCGTSSCHLPTGVTLRGDYSMREIAPKGLGEEVIEATAISSVSFGIPLSVAPKVHYVRAGVENATGTGNLVSGSKIVESLFTESGKFTINSTISGNGIPGGTTIAKVLSSTELELSAAATVTGTGLTLTAGPPPGCTGDPEHPGATSGNLCLFSTVEINNTTALPLPMISTVAECGGFSSEGANAFGFCLESVAESKGLIEDNGTWAVTG